MRLTTKRLEAGLHRVLADGRPTTILLRRERQMAGGGWWEEDGRDDYDREDYLDRGGAPHRTLQEALAVLQDRVDLGLAPATEVLGVGQEEEA